MKNSRKLIVSSLIMILTCCLLFAGTTFAWFSDSVTSNNNIITAGNLDVELYYSTNGTDWDRVDEDTFVINQNTLWEPGHTEAVLLKVVNAGSLALKYSLSLDIVEEQSSINVYGDDFKISDYLKVGTLVSRELGETTVVSNRQEAVKLATTATGFGVINASAKLLANETDYVQVAITIPTTVGNEANYAKGEATPYVVFGVNLLATQVNYEEDSFDENYDKGASWLGEVDTTWYNTTDTEFVIETAEQLAGLAEIVNAGTDLFTGKTIKLGQYIDLNNLDWTPIGTNAKRFRGNFDGNGYTIANLYVNNPSTSYQGLFGFTENGHIENVHVHNASVAGRTGVAVVAGSPYTTTYNNITVTGDVTVDGLAYVGGVFGRNLYADVTNVVVNVTEDSYVNANSVENGTAYRTYVGGVVGFMGEGDHTVSNVTSNIDVYGSTIDVGGITGIAHYGNSFINCVTTGDVTLYNWDGEEGNQYEIGGIAGVWHNGESQVTFEGCEHTGNVTVLKDDVEVEVEFAYNGLVGASYNEEGAGKLYIDGVSQSILTIKVTTEEEFLAALANVTEEVIIDATGVTFTFSIQQDYYVPTGVTIKGARFHSTNRGGNVVYTLAGVGEKVVFEDCIFDRQSTSYLMTVGSDGSCVEMEFNNCTFKGSFNLSYYNYDQGTATYNNCTFNAYDNNEGYIVCIGGNQYFYGCNFNYSNARTGDFGVLKRKAVNASGTDGRHAYVELNGCTLVGCITYAQSGTTIKVK